MSTFFPNVFYFLIPNSCNFLSFLLFNFPFPLIPVFLYFPHYSLLISSLMHSTFNPNSTIFLSFVTFPTLLFSPDPCFFPYYSRLLSFSMCSTFKTQTSAFSFHSLLSQLYFFPIDSFLCFYLFPYYYFSP